VGEAAARNDDVAAAAAHDVAMFDQQGCVSPHVLYVLGGPVPAAEFGRRLAVALQDVEEVTPRGPLTVEEAARIRQVRGAAEFRYGAEVIADAGGTAWTVIVDRDPAFAVSCLNRVVYIKPLGRVEELAGLLKPVPPYLQTVGVAGDDALLAVVAEVVGPMGAARVCRLGRMQHPPLDWRHDGRPRLHELLRWTDVEHDSAPAPPA
jgi:hypothetical protein